MPDARSLMSELTPELVLRGYCAGAFPMADSRDGEVQWFRPDPRTILPLDRFHVPRSLAKRVRSGRFRVSRNEAFADVIRACAEPRPKHPDTWINESIIAAYTELHELGFAHSVEAWSREGDGAKRLVGGLYGVALGSAFFGESMFSRATDASKVCLVHLVDHLRTRGYKLLDVQFTNPHLERFGVEEIGCDEYLRRLGAALAEEVDWEGGPISPAG